MRKLQILVAVLAMTLLAAAPAAADPILVEPSGHVMITNAIHVFPSGHVMITGAFHVFPNGQVMIG